MLVCVFDDRNYGLFVVFWQDLGVLLVPEAFGS